MNEPEEAKRPAKRKVPRKTVDSKNKTVTVSETAFYQVEQSARKLKMSKSKYASAAIAFFAESGLDPTAERPQGLASVGLKVGEGVASVRAHNADIGNRLYALTRGFEKTIYLFMQEQQLATNSYLESIESNLLRHLVSMEVNKLEPMMEQIMKAKFEGYAGRVVTERTYLEVTKKPATDWQGMHQALNGERDQMVVKDLREYAAEHKVPLPKPTPKPSVTPAPQKPVATAPTTSPTPAKT